MADAAKLQLEEALATAAACGHTGVVDHIKAALALFENGSVGEGSPSASNFDHVQGEEDVHKLYAGISSSRTGKVSSKAPMAPRPQPQEFSAKKLRKTNYQQVLRHTVAIPACYLWTLIASLRRIIHTPQALLH
jgi:hypothetical protein